MHVIVYVTKPHSIMPSLRLAHSFHHKPPLEKSRMQFRIDFVIKRQQRLALSCHLLRFRRRRRRIHHDRRRRRRHLPRHPRRIRLEIEIV